MAILRASQVGFDYDGQPVLAGVSLEIRVGERVAILMFMS